MNRFCSHTGIFSVQKIQIRYSNRNNEITVMITNRSFARFLFLIMVLSSCQKSLRISLNNNQDIFLNKPFAIQSEGIESENGMNPDSIKADLIVTTPSGENISVPAYAYKEVTGYTTDTDIYVPEGISKRFWDKQKMPNAGQKVIRYKPIGEWKWSARFNSSDIGKFTARLQVISKGSRATSNEISFVVKNSDSKGFIRIAKSNPKALEYQNGENFLPIGNNLAFAITPISKDRLAAYRQWTDRLHASHANIIRLWPGAEWCFGVETKKPYCYNQEACALLDSVFEMCEAKNIKIIFCLDYVRRFKPATENKAPEFEFRKDYPYLKANGGPCETEDDFLLKDEAKRQWQSYMRYVIARWGAYTSLFSIQLWNEMNCFQSSRENIVRWSNEMGGWLKENDPYHHLRTNSLGSQTVWPDLWIQENIDYISYHDYGGDRYTNTPMYDVFADSLKNLSNIKKPLLLSECGLVDGWLQYPPATHPMWDSAGLKDTTGFGFHEALWIGLMGGGLGSGMHWWWDIMVDDFNYYPQYTAFYELTKDMKSNRKEFGVSKPATSSSQFECFARTSDDLSLYWIVNKKNDWRSLVIKGQKPVTARNASFSAEVAPGQYNICFYSPFDGKMIDSAAITATKTPLTIKLPDFTIDIFVKIIKAP
jgi:hypothetical protein